MSKKDISKIIDTGTAKQKVLLLTEDVAKRKSGMAPILSEEAFQVLLSSISKPNEVRLYNQFRKIDHAVTIGLYVLNQSRMIYRMHISDLRGYALLWESYQRAEETANMILHEITDEDERSRIAKKAASHTAFVLANPTVDKEGYLEIKVKDLHKKDDDSLLKAIAAVRGDAEKELGRTLGYAHALLDYMSERGFKVPTYYDKVKDIIKDVQSDKAVWPKYSSHVYNNYLKPEGRLIRDMERQKIFSVFPDPSEVQLDTAAYNHFKKHVVGYE